MPISTRLFSFAVLSVSIFGCGSGGGAGAGDRKPGSEIEDGTHPGQTVESEDDTTSKGLLGHSNVPEKGDKKRNKGGVESLSHFFGSYCTAIPKRDLSSEGAPGVAYAGTEYLVSQFSSLTGDRFSVLVVEEGEVHRVHASIANAELKCDVDKINIDTKSRALLDVELFKDADLKVSSCSIKSEEIVSQYAILGIADQPYKVQFSVKVSSCDPGTYYTSYIALGSLISR